MNVRLSTISMNIKALLGSSRLSGFGIMSNSNRTWYEQLVAWPKCYNPLAVSRSSFQVTRLLRKELNRLHENIFIGDRHGLRRRRRQPKGSLVTTAVGSKRRFGSHCISCDCLASGLIWIFRCEGTVVREQRLLGLQCEPPFEVLYGRLK